MPGPLLQGTYEERLAERIGGTCGPPGDPETFELTTTEELFGTPPDDCVRVTEPTIEEGTCDLVWIRRCSGDLGVGLTFQTEVEFRFFPRTSNTELRGTTRLQSDYSDGDSCSSVYDMTITMR